MNGGPPTQSEIDYASPVQQVRKPDDPRSSWFVVALVILAATVLGCLWGLQ